MGLVVDASAVLEALATPYPRSLRVRDRFASEICHAPHLIDSEVGHLLRRRVLLGHMTADEGARLLLGSTRLVGQRHEMTGELALAAWELRNNLTYYDALYVALAAILDYPLLTADGRLAHAPRLPCAVEVVRG